MSPLSEAATAETGSFTQPTALENTYTSDQSLQRTLKWYLPPSILGSVESHFIELGAEAVSEKIREWSSDAERNQPYVKSYDVWGRRYDYDRLITAEGWKQLGNWGARRRVVSSGYDSSLGSQRRTVQYALNYLYSPSSGLFSCPISMTDGAAFILSSKIKNLPPTHPFQLVFRRLVDEKEPWTSGQWMTERVGGSDVQNTETFAKYAPFDKESIDPLGEGDYLINGFKFFSSATDANVALLLARTPSGKLSTFLAPLRTTVVGSDGTHRQVSNGVRIHRLKNKLGTKELPTAELELKDMRAHLVGELDQGVVTIAPLLNVTRIHTFIGSLAAFRRAISIAKSFAKVRTTVGEPLWLIPMHLRVLADLEVKHRAGLNLAFFTIAVMGLVEDDVLPPPELPHLPRAGKEATVVFRTLTATTKAVISKMSIAGIQECQEAMGGVGFMDEPDEPEFNLSRLLRNTLVNSIWEGTTNVLASEATRFLLKNFNTFDAWIERVHASIKHTEFRNALTVSWAALKTRFLSNSQNPATVIADGRRYMFTLASILCGTLLALDAERDGDPVYHEIARRWILDVESGVGGAFSDIVSSRESKSSPTESHADWDCRIVWGIDLPQRVSGHRSLNSTSRL